MEENPVVNNELSELRRLQREKYKQANPSYKSPEDLKAQEDADAELARKLEEEWQVQESQKKRQLTDDEVLAAKLQLEDLGTDEDEPSEPSRVGRPRTTEVINIEDSPPHPVAPRLPPRNDSTIQYLEQRRHEGPIATHATREQLRNNRVPPGEQPRVARTSQTSHEPSRQPTTTTTTTTSSTENANSTLAEDEALALRLQQEELDSPDESDSFYTMSQNPTYNFSGNFIPPLDPLLRSNDPFLSDEDDVLPDPYLNMFPMLSELTPPGHPLMATVNDLLSPNNRTTTRRRIVFPNSFFQASSGSNANIPPHLVSMMRGEEETDYESLLQLGEMLQPVSRGASNAIIDAIPDRKFKPGTIAKEEANCGICLSEYENGEEIKSLPMCLHHFHKECIDKWLSINKICPVCREEITLTGRRK